MNLPNIWNGNGLQPVLSNHQQAQLTKRQRTAALELFEYGLQAAARTARDQIDTQALNDAAHYQLVAEVHLLNEGLALAGNSQAGLELVAQKVYAVAYLNKARLNRHFGG